MKKNLTRILSLLLVLVLMVGVLPVSALADGWDLAGELDTEQLLERAEPVEMQASEEDTSVMRIFHLDCGRKYFSVGEITEIIDWLSANHYTHIELAVGNDGMRFLLDDMAVTVGEKTYSHDDVKNAIQAGNKTYYDAGSANELTEAEMNTIISYAAAKGISVIPLLNSPGHMDAILDAATSLTGKNCAYSGSARTIDVTNTTAVAFTQAFIQKYITYFAQQGCAYFNIGADEYANDKTNGFSSLIAARKYGKFIDYVNGIADMIDNAGMTPMAFNDGIYYNSNTSHGTFNKKIVVCYWTTGWPGYSPASASFVASKGHKLINTNDGWYYVLGRYSGTYPLSHAQNGVQNIKYNTLPGNGSSESIGCMQCLWCDEPDASYNDAEKANVKGLIDTFAANNAEVFKSTVPYIEPFSSEPLKVGGTLALSIKNAKNAAATTWSVSAPNVVSLSSTTGETVTLTAHEAGQSTVTANADGKDYTYDVTVVDPNAPKTVPVTVGVGQTITRTQDGVNNSGADKIDKSNYNANIASVSVTGQDGSPATVSYQAKSVYYSTLAGSNADWAKTDYFYQVDGNYYPVYAYLVSDYVLFGYRYYYVGYSVDGGESIIEVVSGSRQDKNIKVYTKSGTEAVPASTTITFTGKSVGETSIKVGNVTYLIEVVDKAPDNALTANTLKLEYWLTNFKVYDGNSASTNQFQTISNSDNGATSDEGIAIDGLSPNVAYSFFDGTITVYYWKTVRLDSQNHQTVSNGVDKTMSGTTLTHVRYNAGAWQYKTLDGTWTYFESGDQVVAYYLQKTTVTKDIETYVKDWGSVPGSGDSNTEGKVALTIAIVYPDGTVQPAEEKMHSEATTIFNYWDNRDIGIILPKVNDNYNINKMTVTDGIRKKGSSSNGNTFWYTNDSITWEKVKNEAGVEWYDETVVWQKSDGTEPVLNGKTSRIIWSAANTAKLVLIYLEPIQKDTNLNIVYHNDTDNEAILQSQIAMVYNAGDAQPTYDNSLHYNNASLDIPYDRKWSGTAPGEPNYLPDEAYVVNAAGNNQTFNKNVAKIPGVAPKYKSGFYKYNGADVSADGKTLTLHYAIDNTKLTKQYVLDFGLPLHIPLKDLIENDDLNTVEAVYANGVPLNSTTDYTTQHGTLRYDAASHEIIYTRTATFSDNTISTANFQIKYAGVAALSKTITIGVIPASNILYEENFLTPDTGSEWSRGTTSSAPTDPQQTQRVVDENGSDIHVFGFDNVYDNKLGETGVWTVTNLSTDKVTGSLRTSFYGNGFDLIGNCGPDTGRILLAVAPVATPKKGVYIVSVDTRYARGNLHQVPLAHVELPNDGAYNVEIAAIGLAATSASSAGRSNVATASLTDVYSTAEDEALLSLVEKYGMTLADVKYVTMDNVIPASDVADVSLYGVPSAAALTAEPQANVEHQQGKHVEIDSFRVYRSTDKNDDIAGKYPTAEQDVVYKNILDVVKGQIVAFTEGNSNTTIQITDYEAAGGPQNEIYIGENQSIIFHVEGATEIQVSLRAVTNAPAQWATSKNGGTPSTIKTNTEMYYTVKPDASGNVTIANRGNTLLAIGNVKLPSGARTMSASEIDEDALRASLCAALGLSAEQPQAFQPKTFTARATTLPMLRNKRVSVLITISNDVSYVTVNGVKYTPSRYYASWQKTRLIQFGETLGKYESKTYTIIAYDANGVASAPITVNG